MDNLEEQIKKLKSNDFDKLTEKYFEIIKSKQKDKFNKTFGNLTLVKYSKINYMKSIYYYYNFNSDEHKYEFGITKTEKNKFFFEFYIDDEYEQHTAKIPEKKAILKGKVNILDYLEEINHDVDINLQELNEIINYLYFGNHKFIYNIL